MENSPKENRNAPESPSEAPRSSIVVPVRVEVWKVLLALQKQRPDLFSTIINPATTLAFPTITRGEK